MNDLTGAQLRVLAYLGLGAKRRILAYLGLGGRWISLKELDEALRADDIVTVPSLIERGLIEHRVGRGTVRIAAEGKQALGMR